MRTPADRIRHALSFEIIALLIITPLGAWVFDHPLDQIGIVTVVSATIAMGFNYVYNWGFDHAMLRWRGTLTKTVQIRIVHAILFEAGLFLILVPFIIWYLDAPFAQSAAMDLSFSAFYLIYAFCFNWLYDVVFPLPKS